VSGYIRIVIISRDTLVEEMIDLVYKYVEFFKEINIHVFCGSKSGEKICIMVLSALIKVCWFYSRWRLLQTALLVLLDIQRIG